MRRYISHQKARSFGSLAYRKAKNGFNMLVTCDGVQCWLGYVVPHGFYVYPFESRQVG